MAYGVMDYKISSFTLQIIGVFSFIILQEDQDDTI